MKKKKQEYPISEYWGRKKLRRAGITAAICAGLALLSSACYLFCRWCAPAGKVSEIYTDHVFYDITWPLKKIIGIFPFSFTELLLYLGAAFLIAAIPLTLIKTIRNVCIYCSRKKHGLVPTDHMPLWRPAAQLGLRIVSVLCAVLTAFFAFGGINYTSLTFAEKAGYVLEETESEQLYRLCLILGEQASAARKNLILNGNSTINENHPEYNPYRLIDDAVSAFQNLPEEYEFLKKEYPRAKLAVGSVLMSNIHITGIYPYFLPEAIVNADTPIMSLPHTICHEMSHQRGFAREDEANYIAFLACVYSENPLFIYSGYYTAFSYAMNALYRYDTEKWSQAASRTDRLIWFDQKQESDFWAQYESVSQEFTSSVNDTYLTVMDVEDGVHSYGRMVDLLLAEAKRDGIL